MKVPRWFLVSGALALIALGGLVWAHRPGTPPPEMGQPLEAPLPAELVGPIRFEPRGTCHWRTPGGNRFIGDVTSALAAVGVRQQFRSQLSSDVSGHQSVGRVRMARGAIRASNGMLYNPIVTMTWGRDVVCYQTELDFDGEQGGDLYEVGGYWIVVMDVCGNVARIYPTWESRHYSESRQPDVLYSYPGGLKIERRFQPYEVVPGWEREEALSAGYRRGVPEPEMFALLSIGLSAYALVRRLRK